MIRLDVISGSAASMSGEEHTGHDMGSASEMFT
jgi:hypothetical protein